MDEQVTSGDDLNMDISTERLKNLLGEAFELGYQNSAELKNQLLEELMLRAETEVSLEDKYKIYKVEELRNQPVGAVFQHMTRGRGWIIQKHDGSKWMEFQKGSVVGFNQDGDPWDRPMRLLHAEK